MKGLFVKNWLLCLFLVFLTFAAFYPVVNNGFVSYDDPDYITENQYVQMGLSPESVKWAFISTRTSNWHPMTWLSLMADYEIWGMNPAGFHLTSLIIHIINGLLLYLLLYRVSGMRFTAFFAALIFAIHPLRVESVAWAAERKDVLSGLFFLAVLWSYYFYSIKVSFRRYLAVLICLALGLMSKPMLVSVPAVLFLMDYWPLKRFKKCRVQFLIIEKIPLAVTALLSSAVTLVVQEKAMEAGADYSLAVRFANAVSAYAGYLGKFFRPAELSVLYSHPGGVA